jgi:chromosome segregation ATPase
MKTAIKSLLSAFGLAPASHVDHLNTDARRAEAKIAQLEAQIAQLRADSESWKRRYDDATEGLAGWKQSAHRAEAETERAKGGAERIKADVERARADFEREQARTADWRRRAEALTAELQDMRVRLENAHRATDSANEQLMAMEVKLDLIEAAIQVLDTRTREQAVSRSL